MFTTEDIINASLFWFLYYGLVMALVVWLIDRAFSANNNKEDDAYRRRKSQQIVAGRLAKFVRMHVENKTPETYRTLNELENESKSE